MLGENIKFLRKQRGYSQDTLADQLHVVRQTISKWEKGLSVPDAEMLSELANLFEVPVSQLLGEKLIEDNSQTGSDEVAKQLSILNDHLVSQSRRRKRTMRITLVTVVTIFVLAMAGYTIAKAVYKLNHASDARYTIELQCVLNGEKYTYGITYDDQYNIIEAGGDAWIADHVQTEQYEDANILMAQIESYFTDRGGTCQIVKK